MEYVWTILFIIVLVLCLGLLIFSLPGTWVVMALLAGWMLLFPDSGLSWGFWIFLCILAGVAELIEFLAQMYGTKKYGGSNLGNIGGIIGAIVGAIVGAAFLFGFGAIPGALIGAFGGCYIVELLRGLPAQQASTAAWGAFWGKLAGLTVKLGIGFTIVALAAYKIWPAGEVAV